MVELLVAEDAQTSLELGELVRMAVEEVSRGTKWSSIESTGVERPLSTGTNLKRSLGGWSPVGRELPAATRSERFKAAFSCLHSVYTGIGG